MRQVHEKHNPSSSNREAAHAPRRSITEADFHKQRSVSDTKHRPDEPDKRHKGKSDTSLNEEGKRCPSFLAMSGCEVAHRVSFAVSEIPQYTGIPRTTVEKAIATGELPVLESITRLE